MDRLNRWRRRAGTLACAAGTALLCFNPSYAQQQSSIARASPSARPVLRPSQSNLGRPADLRGTSFGGEPINAAPNQLADFNRGTVVHGNTDADAGSERASNPGPDNNSAVLEPDTRSQRDRDPFESPPAGHGPRYFQIEVDPLNDRRTRQFFEAGPYQHLGWRLGSFILYQEFDIAPAWQSNVFLESSGRADWRADLNSETRLVSDWANHAVELRMVHDRSFHRAFTNENDAGQLYELRGRVDISKRTNIEALASRGIQQESRNSVDASGSASQPRDDVVTDRINVALNHRFNRLSLQLRGGHSATNYEETAAAANTSRDVKTNTTALRLQWEFRPTFSVFGEFERDDRRHRAVTSTDGLTRSSEGERYRAGVALGQTGEYLRGEASVGYGVQRPDAVALSETDAFLVDANVAWRITPLTSVLLNASTSFGETTLAGAAGSIDRTTGVTVRHALRQNLIGEAGVSYGTQEYPGNTLSERNLTFNTNVEYSLNRHAALFSRYEHIRFRSSDATRDYNASTLMFGARIRN